MTKAQTSAVIGNSHIVLSMDGTTVSYLSVGDGPAVIVLPGVLSMASDYAAFARAWQSDPDAPTWNPLADISEPNDNIIDFADLDIFIQNW